MTFHTILKPIILYYDRQKGNPAWCTGLAGVALGSQRNGSPPRSDSGPPEGNPRRQTLRSRSPSGALGCWAPWGGAQHWSRGGGKRTLDQWHDNRDSLCRVVTLGELRLAFRHLRGTDWKSSFFDWALRNSLEMILPVLLQQCLDSNDSWALDKWMETQPQTVLFLHHHYYHYHSSRLVIDSTLYWLY